MRIHAVVAALAVMVASCATAEPSESMTGRGPEEVGTTAAVPDDTATTALDEGTSTSRTPTTTSAPPATIPEADVEIVGGEVVGPDRFEVVLGDEVDIWVLSDSDEQVHVHGYDLNFELDAGVPLSLSFDADVPGLFEVETHTGETLLFEIEVTG